MAYRLEDGERPKRRWLKGIAIIILMIGLGRVAGWLTGRAIADEPVELTAGELAAEAARELGKKVPAQVNEFVMVSSVEANGQELVQNMTTTRDLSEEDMKKVRVVDQLEICRNEGYKQLIAQGGVVRLVYTDSRGEVFNVRVGQCAVPI